MRKRLLLAALRTSCHDPYQESALFITNEQKCWYLLRYPDKQLKNKAGFSLEGCTKFYPNNTYQSFAVVNKQFEIQTPLEDDLSTTGRWSFSPTDSVFFIDERKYFVKKITADTLYLLNEESTIENLINYRFK
jgi:hypothetical protein